QAQASMYDDAIQDDPDTLQGQSYKVILDTANRSRPDMTNDPIFNATRDVTDDFDEWNDSFGDCTTEEEFVETEKTVHVPEYETCERVTDKSQDCSIVHDYKVGVVEHHSGPLNLDSCGEGCMSMWIGERDDNYWSGWCTIFERETAVSVLNPDAITKAELDYVEFDDYIQVLVGPKGEETKVYNGPNDLFPPETEGPCELSTSWKRNPNKDVTKHFTDVEKSDVVNFKVRVSVRD